MREFTFTLSGGSRPVIIPDLPVNAVGASVNIYELGVHTGTLADNAFNASCQFVDGQRYTAIRDSSILSESYSFKMEKADGSPFAWGEVEARHIVFPDNEGSYSMNIHNNRFSKEKYRHHYKFMMNKKVHCEIRYGLVDGTGWFKRNFSSVSSEGIALLSDSLNRDYLLGFMLLFTRYLIAPVNSDSGVD